jgi:transglutaminase-like putative cysteine protease
MARFACLSMLVFSCAAAAQERWFEVRIADAPSGRAHELVGPAPGGGLETSSESQTLITRLKETLDIRVRARTIEGEDGRLRAVHVETDFSAQTSVCDATFEAERATVTERSGDSAPKQRTVVLAAPLFGPEALRRQSGEALRKPGDTLLLPLWAPELGMPVQVRRTVLALEGGGLRVEEKYEGMPIARTLWLGDGAELQRAESPAPFGTIAMVRTASEPALTAASLPAGTFERTLLRSNVRLPQPRALQRMVARLSPADAITSDTQRVEGGLVEVRRAAPPSDSPDSSAGEEFLAANLLVDSDDPGVRKIVDEVPGEGWTRALALTRWTSRQMKFDAGIVFAPASELARDRRGTCVGYATLLASLLRAAQIPARLVFGYVYTGGIFGGHAWVEARFGSRWIPLDAALPSDGPADAARIALVADSLRDGPGRALGALQHGYTDSSITIVEYGGAVAKAPPYQIEDGAYVNPGLGFSMAPPPGLRFDKLDAVWPDRTLFSLSGRGGAVKLKIEEDELDPSLPLQEALRAALGRPCKEQRIAGRIACAGRGGFALADGATVYVVEAGGPGAARLLDDASRRIVLR